MRAFSLIHGCWVMRGWGGGRVIRDWQREWASGEILRGIETGYLGGVGGRGMVYWYERGEKKCTRNIRWEKGKMGADTIMRRSEGTEEHYDCQRSTVSWDRVVVGE